jgi:D-amino-acid dehydrogenase
LGVTFLWETEVQNFSVEGTELRAVQTSRGDIASDAFVLASGVWSTAMARTLSLKLPMQAGKGYSLTLTEPRELPALCSICTEARLAVTPMDGALRVGGTMEMAGLDERITQRRVQGIMRAFPRYFPEFSEADFADITPWSGLRPVAPDGLPYVGRSARWSNLIVATGHAMMGLSLAAGTGHLVGQLLNDEVPSVDLRLLSPDRFA